MATNLRIMPTRRCKKKDNLYAKFLAMEEKEFEERESAIVEKEKAEEATETQIRKGTGLKQHRGVPKSKQQKQQEGPRKRVYTPEQKLQQQLRKRLIQQKHERREGDFVRLLEEMRDFMADYLKYYPDEIGEERVQNVLQLLDEAQEVAEHFVAKRRRCDIREGKRMMRLADPQAPLSMVDLRRAYEKVALTQKVAV